MSGVVYSKVDQTRYRLLIYIPTYNRSSLVVGQVERILPQVLLRNDVYLLISDNASPDESYQKLAPLIQSANNAEIRTLPGNVGGNANALLGFSCDIKSDYIWILADDTLVSMNAVVNILTSLETNPDMLTLMFAPNERPRTSYDIKSEGLAAVFGSTPWGLFSAVVYSRTLIANSIESGFSYHESSFPHLAILFDSCWKSSRPISISQLTANQVFSSFEDDPVNAYVYTLSLTGLPMLLDFATLKEKRRLGRRWAWSNSVGISAFQKLHPIGARASKASLVASGGIVAWFFLIAGATVFRIQRSPIGPWLERAAMQQAWLRKLLVSSKLTLFRLDRGDVSSEPK